MIPIVTNGNYSHFNFMCFWFTFATIGILEVYGQEIQKREKFYSTIFFIMGFKWHLSYGIIVILNCIYSIKVNKTINYGLLFLIYGIFSSKYRLKLNLKNLIYYFPYNYLAEKKVIRIEKKIFIKTNK